MAHTTQKSRTQESTRAHGSNVVLDSGCDEKQCVGPDSVRRGIQMQVSSTTVDAWRYRLWFPTGPGDWPAFAFDPKKGLGLDVGKEARLGDLGFATDLSLDVTTIASAANVDPNAKGTPSVELTSGAP